MRVETYFNLHKKCLSVRAMEGKNRGQIIAHVDDIALTSTDKFPVKFAVQEAGRQRVLQEQQKNVHAFVRGAWYGDCITMKDPKVVTYNPYKYDSFVLKEDPSHKVFKARKVLIQGKNIYAELYDE